TPARWPPIRRRAGTHDAAAAGQLVATLVALDYTADRRGQPQALRYALFSGAGARGPDATPRQPRGDRKRVAFAARGAAAVLGRGNATGTPPDPRPGPSGSSPRCVDRGVAGAPAPATAGRARAVRARGHTQRLLSGRRAALQKPARAARSDAPALPQRPLRAGRRFRCIFC